MVNGKVMNDETKQYTNEWLHFPIKGIEPIEELEIIEIGDEANLQELARDIRVKGDPDFKIYAQSPIEVKELRIDNISPMTLYVLTGGLIQQHRFVKTLKEKHNIDYFRHKGSIKYNQSGSVCKISPPVVERYTEEDGTTHYGLIDGTHRVVTAKQLGEEYLVCIVISNPLLPPYAIPNRWDEVILREDTPPTNQKKKFRNLNMVQWPEGLIIRPDVDPRYYLYRDYSMLGSYGIR